MLLWRADGFDAGPLYTWPGTTRGRFNSMGTQVCVCVSCWLLCSGISTRKQACADSWALS